MTARRLLPVMVAGAAAGAWLAACTPTVAPAGPSLTPEPEAAVVVTARAEPACGLISYAYQVTPEGARVDVWLSINGGPELHQPSNPWRTVPVPGGATVTIRAKAGRAEGTATATAYACALAPEPSPTPAGETGPSTPLAGETGPGTSPAPTPAPPAGASTLTHQPTPERAGGLAKTGW